MSPTGETKLAILRELKDMIEIVEVSVEGRGKKYYELTEDGELLQRLFEKANS